MIWAEFDNTKILAIKGINTAVCPLCKEIVIPKCGDINIHHWAHKKCDKCDSFAEGETDWHRTWKNLFPEKNQEVIVGKHRADIKTRKGLIIEFQNSPISYQQILEREKFYKNMIWILNGSNFVSNLELRKKNNDIYTFRWKYPHKSWWGASKQIFVDIGDETVFYMKKIYHNIPCGGWGRLLKKEEFINGLL